MTGSVRQTNFLQPVQSLLLGLVPLHASHQQRHSDILQGRKLWQQIMKLPDKPKLPAAKLCSIFFGETTELELGEVYVTFGSAIKRSEYVK